MLTDVAGQEFREDTVGWLVSAPWCLGPQPEILKSCGWLNAGGWKHVKPRSLTCLAADVIIWDLSRAVGIPSYDLSLCLHWLPHSLVAKLSAHVSQENMRAVRGVLLHWLRQSQRLSRSKERGWRPRQSMEGGSKNLWPILKLPQSQWIRSLNRRDLSFHGKPVY